MSAERCIQMICTHNKSLYVCGEHVLPGASFDIDALSAAKLLRVGKARLVNAWDMRATRKALHKHEGTGRGGHPYVRAMQSLRARRYAP